LKIASLEQGKHFEENQEEVEIFVIGGGQIYAEAMPKATRLYITHVDAEIPADTFFPEISIEEWEKVSDESHSADEENSYDYTFTIWDRKQNRT
jgi:dihydrofolate reductase